MGTSIDGRKHPNRRWVSYLNRNIQLLLSWAKEIDNHLIWFPQYPNLTSKPNCLCTQESMKRQRLSQILSPSNPPNLVSIKIRMVEPLMAINSDKALLKQGFRTPLKLQVKIFMDISVWVVSTPSSSSSMLSRAKSPTLYSPWSSSWYCSAKIPMVPFCPLLKGETSERKLWFELV